MQNLSAGELLVMYKMSFVIFLPTKTFRFVGNCIRYYAVLEIEDWSKNRRFVSENCILVCPKTVGCLMFIFFVLEIIVQIYPEIVSFGIHLVHYFTLSWRQVWSKSSFYLDMHFDPHSSGKPLVKIIPSDLQTCLVKTHVVS